MSEISGIIGSVLGGEAQKSSAKTAAGAQVQATQYATDAMLKMWEKAQQDFAPYLEAGETGLSTLTNQLPQYISSTLAPIAEQFGNYQLTPLPSTGTGMVNPVTGEMTQYSPDQGTVGQGSASQTQQQYNQNQMYSLWPGYRGGETVSLPSATSQNAMATTQGTNQQIPGLNMPLRLANIAGNVIQRGVSNATTEATPLQTSMPQIGNNAFSAQYRPMTQTSAGATTDQLEQGGVLSPVVPEFQRSLENYEFNTEDPYYQTRLAQKNEEINAFLAKSGLTGSTAGETYRQRELDDFNAGEYDRQYGRALTERNYLTQTDIDKYNLEATRGNTLYGRQYQSGQDLYNRELNNALTGDTRNQQQLLDIYNLMSGLYGTQYGSALDLANLGSQATSATGAGALQTGQSIGQNALSAGNALAQSALASGQANAGIWNSIGQAPANALSTYNYLSSGYNQQQPQNYYYGGGGFGGYSNPTGGYSDISWNMPY